VSANIKSLSKSEYLEVMKSLPIESLREPLSIDNKLWKKHIKGFAPGSTPLHLLVNMYYTEIKSGNTKLQSNLEKLINGYIYNKVSSDRIKAINQEGSLEMLLNFGIDLAKEHFDLDIKLLFKIVENNIDEEKIVIITNAYNSYNKEFLNLELEKNSILIELEESKSSINRLNSANKKLQNNIRNLDENISEYKKNISRLESLAVDKDKLLNDLGLRNEELNKILEQKNKKEAELEHSCKQYADNNESLKSKNIELTNYIKNISEEFEEYRQQKSLLFNDTIAKLVKDTISDLDINFDLEENEYSKILECIEGEHSLCNVWSAITNKNIKYLNDIENSMKTNIIHISQLDILDELENNVCFKFITLKALKVLFFEYLGQQEKEKTISSKIFNRD